MRRKKKYVNGGEFFNTEGTEGGFNFAQAAQLGVPLINAVTTKKSGRQSIGGSTLSGAASGAAAGATLGPWGAAVGGVVGAVGGVVKGIAGKEKEEAEIRAMEAAAVRANIQRSNAILSTSNTSGNAKAGFRMGGRYKCAYGAQIPSPINGGSKEGIASDAAVYSGNTHEQGGIDLNNDIEIEDGEVIQKDRVYSDRIKPNKDTIEVIKRLGFKVNGNDTFASLSESLLRKKGAFENHTGDPLSQSTAKAMSNRIDGALDIVFQDQQQQNEQGMRKKYAFGGNFSTDPNDPKKKTLVETDPNAPKFKTPQDHNKYYTQLAANKLKEIDPDLYVKFETAMKEGDINTAEAYIAARGGIPSYVPIPSTPMNTTPTNWGALDSGSSKTGGYRYNIGQGKPAKGSITRKRAYGGYSDPFNPSLPLIKKPFDFNTINSNKDFVPPVGATEGVPPSQSAAPINNPLIKTKSNKFEFGDAANIVGTIANQAIIGKMKTNTPARTITPTGFSYTNMSSPILNKNAESFRAAKLALERSGQDNSGTIANMFASKLGADADIASSEASRRQSAVDNYLNRTQQIDATNAGILSQNDFYNTQRGNEKLALTQGNIDNFIQGTLASADRKSAIALDKDKAKLIGALEGNRGIIDRLKANPELAEILKRVLGQ